MDEPLAPLQGPLDVLILKSLTWQPMRGYAVRRWIRARSGDALSVEDAALYQALHRLERHGRVASQWGVSESNRRARYYALTEVGRAHQLRQEAETGRRYAGAVASVLDTTSLDPA